MDNQFKPSDPNTNTELTNSNPIQPEPVAQPAAPVYENDSPSPLPTEQPIVAPADVSRPSSPLPSFDEIMAQEKASNNVQATNSVESSTNVSAPRKKSRNPKKILLSLIAFLLIVGGGALVYFFVFKKTEPAAPVVSQPVQQEAAPLAKDSIFYQAGQKIIKYDTKQKTKTELTNKLPQDATILNFYTEGTSWRAYAVHNGEDETKAYYLESNSQPKEIYTKKEYVETTANAKAKLFAYTESFNPSGEPTASKTNKHYLLKNEEAVLLSESESLDSAKGGAPENNLKQLSWGVAGVSPNGDKLLFRYLKRYGDGGVPGSLEYDVASKKTRLVSKDGAAHFGADGKIYIEKTNQPGLGWFQADQPLQVTLSEEAAAGTFKDIMVVSDTKWAALTYQKPSGKYFVVGERGPQYPQEGVSIVGGLYETIKPNEHTKLDVKNLPSKYGIFEIGPSSSQEGLKCFGVVLSPLDTSDIQAPVIYKTGAICKDDKQTYAFEEVESVTTPADKPFQTPKML